MNKSIKSLYDSGLLSFGREKAVHDVLKYIVNTSLKGEGDKTIITLKKGGRKYNIIIAPNSARTSGDEKFFRKELEQLESSCLNEFAVSVRSKKELLLDKPIGVFFKFVLVPVLFDVYNYHGLKIKEFCRLLNQGAGEKRFLIFKIKKNMTAKCINKSISVLFNNAHFSVKLKGFKPKTGLLDKNLDVGRFQNNNRDAFFAGLPYTLKALSGYDYDYSFNGGNSALEEICKTILETLYKYLMMERV